MEDAPVPIMTPNLSIPIEKKLININIEFNNDSYNFSLFDINNKIKVQIKGENNEDNDIGKYETILELDILKCVNKYFKMFDSFEEFKNDFIELCIPSNIKIIKVDDKEIILNLELVIKPVLTINLNRVQMNQKDQIDFLIKENRNKNKNINNLNIYIQKLKDKITSL